MSPNMPLLVALVQRKIHDDPDVYPTIGCLVGIELGTVHGKHQNKIVIADVTLLDLLEIVGTMKEIIIR